MLLRIKRYLWNSLVNLPDHIWHIVQHGLGKIIHPDTFERICMERYARYLQAHFDEAWKRVVRNQKCMLIEKGDFAYSYFNVAYVNNVMTLIFYAMYKGCVPIIYINQDQPLRNKWDWYFDQPCSVMNTDITDFEIITCDILNHDIRPDMQMIHMPGNWKYGLFRLLFQKFLRLNTETQAYVDEEIKHIGAPSEMLGVLMRGTDYIKLRPKGHPVQPEPEEIVVRAAEQFSKGGFSAVYVATEEKRLYDMVGAAVGQENIRENKRQYYDELYYKSNEVLIGKVRFERENDNYWKGLEYLSSLMILSQCKTLVAGNCGGTLFAALMGEYDAPLIFNYGVYP